MGNEFVFFEGTRTESATDPKITVRKGGVLVLTQAAVEMLGEGAENVQIGFNPKTRALGLRRVGEGSPGSYRLREQRNSKSRLVSGKRAFAHHGLQTEKATSYEAQDFGEGVVGIVLPKEEQRSKARARTSRT